MDRGTRAHRISVVIAFVVGTTVLSLADTIAPTPAAAQDGFGTTDVIGPPGTQRFGERVLVLSNGNYVVSDPRFDDGAIVDAGAVFLYDGVTDQLISTLKGSHANDLVGLDGMTEVGTSDFIVLSSQFQNAGLVDTGAVTRVDGTLGLNAAVSASNSLVGPTSGDFVGYEPPVVLANGNYVLTTSTWDNGPIVDAGAITWGSGQAGVSGAITSANSQVGAVANALAGTDGVVALTNGNYVSISSLMPIGAVDQAGAVTWGNGTTGSTGTISAANSLVGSSDDDMAGIDGVVALTNGNYIVVSSDWDNGAIDGAGAVTWGNGTTGVKGAITPANSLVGSSDADYVGFTAAIALTNGNYAVGTTWWDNGPLDDAGAITWGNGVTGTTGPVSTANSLVGAQPGDSVGRLLTPLSNGAFVAASPFFDNGATPDVGAATRVSGSAVTTGFVTAANSLVGPEDDSLVGSNGIVALTNGNYVVASSEAVLGGDIVGAATWRSGSVSSGAIVSVGNSLVGSHDGDGVATVVTPLPNGDYVVVSPDATIGAIDGAGAVTHGNGTVGTTGIVTVANSLVGATIDDHVGFAGTDGDEGITVLGDGNYTVYSEQWDNGRTTNVGALTWRSANGSAPAVVSSANSLVGIDQNEGDIVARPSAVSDGSYVVVFAAADHGNTNVGAAVWAPPGGLSGSIDGERTVYGTATFGGFRMISRRGRTASGALIVGRSADNRITLLRTDTTSPFFTTPVSDITVVAAQGATAAAVDYTVPTAADDNGHAVVACSPSSGSAFSIGNTVVTCTATNTVGLTATATFTVTVDPAPANPGEGNRGGGGGASVDYVPLVPARLVDTRALQNTIDGRLAAGGVVTAGTTLTVPVAGRGGVAADALAAALNVTAVSPAVDAFVTVFPCGSMRPTASNLNVDAGAIAPNTVLAKLGTDGAVCIYVSQTTHLVVDVNGYFPATSTYAPANPQRVLDSRQGEHTADGLQEGGGLIPAGTTTELQVTGRVGVPADAAGVALNVTVTGAQGNGFVTVYPCGAGRPTASSLNASGSDVANLVLASVGANGKVCLFNQVPMHLVADVNGWFPASTTYAPLTPDRLLDTRLDGGPAVAAGSVTELRVAGVRTVPAGVSTVVLNVTVTEPAGDGFVTVYPCGVERPLASNLNFTAGQTVPNAVVVKVGTNGSVCLYASQPTHLVVDANGSFPS